MLRAIPGIEDIALSTNGVKLPELAPSLRAAGLDRVNIERRLACAPIGSPRIARRNLGFDPRASPRWPRERRAAPIKINVVVHARHQRRRDRRLRAR